MSSVVMSAEAVATDHYHVTATPRGASQPRGFNPSSGGGPSFRVGVFGQLRRTNSFRRYARDLAPLTGWFGNNAADIELTEAGQELERVQKEEPVAGQSTWKRKWAVVRARVWLALEEPDSSVISRIYFIFLILSVVLSIFSFCISTVPGIRTRLPPSAGSAAFAGSGRRLLASQEPGLDAFDVIEAICTSYFTLDFVLRFVFTPAPKWFFMLELRSMIDVIALIPFYLFLIMEAASPGASYSTDGASVLHFLRLMRMGRLLKLALIYPPALVFVEAMRRSRDAVIMLWSFFCFGVVWWATILWYCEIDNQTDGFESIPASFWWALVTMSTVGYGDVVPRTWAGKLNAGLCMFSALLLLSLPIGVIGSNFIDVTNEFADERADKVEARRLLKEAEEAAAKDGEAPAADASEAITGPEGLSRILTARKSKTVQDALQSLLKHADADNDPVCSGLVKTLKIYLANKETSKGTSAVIHPAPDE